MHCNVRQSWWAAQPQQAWASLLHALVNLAMTLSASLGPQDALSALHGVPPCAAESNLRKLLNGIWIFSNIGHSGQAHAAMVQV